MKFKNIAKTLMATIGAIIFIFQGFCFVNAEMTEKEADARWGKCEKIEKRIKKYEEKISQLITEEEKVVKQEGIVAFKKAEKIFKKAKSDFAKNCLVYYTNGEKVNREIGKDFLDKGVEYTIKKHSEILGIDKKLLENQEYIKMLEMQKNKLKVMAEAAIKGPKYITKLIVNTRSDSCILFDLDDEALKLIEENLKIAKTFFGDKKDKEDIKTVGQ